jgi:hypothetical protein
MRIAVSIGLTAIGVTVFTIASRKRWDLFGWVFASGMACLSIGGPIVFLGFLIKGANGPNHNNWALWIGAVLCAIGLAL